jgi:hypothetical protein
MWEAAMARFKHFDYEQMIHPGELQEQSCRGPLSTWIA